MALIIHIDGKVEDREGMTFAEAKEAIGGGYVQDVPIRHEKYCGIICDENGKAKGMEANHHATGLVGSYLLPFDFLVGTIILYSKGEIYSGN